MKWPKLPNTIGHAPVACREELDLRSTADAFFWRPTIRFRQLGVARCVPFQTPFQIVAVLHDFELRPQHLIVGFLLIVQLLKVREHHAELGLHVRGQLVRFPLWNDTLDLHARHDVLLQDGDITLPRKVALEEVDQDVNETLQVVLSAHSLSLQGSIRCKVRGPFELIALGF